MFRYNNNQLNLIALALVQEKVKSYDNSLGHFGMSEEQQRFAKGVSVVKKKGGEVPETVPDEIKYAFSTNSVCHNFSVDGKRVALLPVSTDFNGPGKEQMPLLNDVLRNYKAYVDSTNDVSQEIIVPVVERKQIIGEDHVILMHVKPQGDGTFAVTTYDPKAGRIYDTGHMKKSVQSTFFPPEEAGAKNIFAILIDFFKNLFKKDVVAYKPQAGWGHQQILDTESCGPIVGTYIEDVVSGKKIGTTFKEAMEGKDYKSGMEAIRVRQCEAVATLLNGNTEGYTIDDVFPSNKTPDAPENEKANSLIVDDFNMDGSNNEEDSGDDFNMNDEAPSTKFKV